MLHRHSLSHIVPPPHWPTSWHVADSEEPRAGWSWCSVSERVTTSDTSDWRFITSFHESSVVPLYIFYATTEDRATLGSDPSAVVVAKRHGEKFPFAYQKLCRDSMIFGADAAPTYCRGD